MKTSAFKNIKGLLLGIILGISAFVILPEGVCAGTPTDEIIDYEITADVNEEDATVDLHYHIEWLVLDSDELGPLEWVKIGRPNNHTENYHADSDNIDKIDESTSDGSYIEVYFKDKYYAGETVSFDYTIEQDYMYSVNKYEDGYSVYSFTPGWFDDIAVDNLTIRWNGQDVDSWSPDALYEGKYLTWNTSLKPGDKYTITVTYPNDAVGFDLSFKDDGSEYGHGKLYDLMLDAVATIIGVGLVLFVMAIPFFTISFLIYVLNAGLTIATGKDKKITRTKVVYYPTCQSCGAVRKEGEKFCTYCGSSFIKSEETVEEKDIPKDEKDLLKKNKNGEYMFSNSPNTYMRVNVVHVPIPKNSFWSSHTSSHGSSHSHHSGGCAHSSCACACACACAGGGRAGCTTKDFYNTKLKMKNIKKAVK